MLSVPTTICLCASCGHAVRNIYKLCTKQSDKTESPQNFTSWPPTKHPQSTRARYNRSRTGTASSFRWGSPLTQIDSCSTPSPPWKLDGIEEWDSVVMLMVMATVMESLQRLQLKAVSWILLVPFLIALCYFVYFKLISELKGKPPSLTPPSPPYHAFSPSFHSRTTSSVRSFHGSSSPFPPSPFILRSPGF